MLYCAEATSLAIRVCASWTLTIPAIAMARVRLEQAIVCSYLSHEQESLGLSPYIAYIKIGRHRRLKAALAYPGMAELLPAHIDAQSLEREAKQAQEEVFEQSFNYEDGRLVRKWTPLDLLSMAKKRDRMASEGEQALKEDLAGDYMSLYNQSSAVVHAECSSLTPEFLDIFAVPGSQPVLMALPQWTFIILAFVARYDVLQCYEVLSYLDINANDEYVELWKRWAAARRQYLGNKAAE